MKICRGAHIEFYNVCRIGCLLPWNQGEQIADVCRKAEGRRFTSFYTHLILLTAA